MTNEVNLIGGWIGILAGVLCGAVMGVFFHDENWLGGYGTFARRLTRLGHISFFGLGFVNILFGLTIREMVGHSAELRVASISLLIGAAAMPICCFLTAWKKGMRHLFPIPVAAVTVGIVALLMSWR